ncbi:MAG: hypothetical protein ACK5DD_08400 [Cyclobacteriaceae bacterium]|jgi:hypothetical protein
MKRMKRGYKIALVIVFGVVAVIAFGYATMLLWNWLVPDLFGGPIINFWQTLGLLLLSKILFSGLGGKGSRGRGHWKEKLSTMSPEDRELFKQKMKDKWCRWEEEKSGGTSANG